MFTTTPYSSRCTLTSLPRDSHIAGLTTDCTLSCSRATRNLSCASGSRSNSCTPDIPHNATKSASGDDIAMTTCWNSGVKRIQPRMRAKSFLHGPQPTNVVLTSQDVRWKASARAWVKENDERARSAKNKKINVATILRLRRRCFAFYS